MEKHFKKTFSMHIIEESLKIEQLIHQLYYNLYKFNVLIFNF